MGYPKCAWQADPSRVRLCTAERQHTALQKFLRERGMPRTSFSETEALTNHASHLISSWHRQSAF